MGSIQPKILYQIGILEQTPQLSQVSILIRQDPTIQIQTNVSSTPPYLGSSISSGILSNS